MRMRHAIRLMVMSPLTAITTLRMSRRVAVAAAVIAVLLLALGAGSATADVGPIPTPSVPDLNPLDNVLPSVGDLAGKLIEGIVKALFGDLEAKVSLAIVKFLVAHPIVTDPSAYGPLNNYRGYVTDGAWGLLSLVLVVSSFRYWASGLAGGGAYEALQGFVRTAVSAGLLTVYAFTFAQLLVAGNLLTHALLAYSGIEAGLAKLFIAGHFALGLGGIAYVLETIAFIALIVTKIALTAMLSLLLVSGPLAIALWPIDELSWLARTWMQTLFAVLLWPVIWALCFGAFATMGDAAFAAGGPVGDMIIKPFVAVAMLYIAFRVPLVVLRQAQLAGITPNVGRGAMRGAQMYSVGSRLASGGGNAASAGASAATTAADAAVAA
jgi:hypothetical protein